MASFGLGCWGRTEAVSSSDGSTTFRLHPLFFFRCNVEAQEIRLECQRQGEKGASLATPTC